MFKMCNGNVVTVTKLLFRFNTIKIVLVCTKREIIIFVVMLLRNVGNHNTTD